MGFIFTLILFAATLILSEVLKPKPNVENARPAGLGDFQAPTATEGRPVPIIFGTVLQKGPNVIWYGDLRIQTITEKVKTGLFSSKRVTKGFRYFLGLQMAISRGDENWRLRKIRISEEDVWTGNQGEGSIQIDAPNVFGGEENGSGGVVGTLSVRIGTETQFAPTYMNGRVPGVAGAGAYNYRGTAFVTFEQGGIGTSANLEPWAFEATRITDQLSLGGNATVNTYDANPANVIYEILTNDEWGLGLPASKVNATQMSASGVTLATEGNGFSFIWDQKRDLQDILREIERQIDGIVSTNPSTGQFEILLARGGYDINTIPQINEDDIVGNDGVQNFQRGAWEDTQNFIQVQYQHREREYADAWAPAVDEGNIKIQLGNVVNANLTYPGVKDPALANTIAWRELRTLSAPLLKVTLRLDRRFWDLRPNDVVAWTDEDLGLVQLPLRATRINKGTLTEGSILVDFVEDVFVFDTPAFVTPGAGEWDPPSDQLIDIPAADRQIFEAPRAFCDRDGDAPGAYDRPWVGVRNQGDGAINADIFQNGTTDIGDLSQFSLAGTLNATLNNTDDATATSIRVDAGPDSRAILLSEYPDTVTTGQIGSDLAHLIRIGDELLSFTSMTDLSPTFDAVQLNNVRRALCDTVQPGTAGHASGSRVWFLLGNITSPFERLSPLSIEILTASTLDALTPGEASPTNFALNDRAHRPYPPTRLLVNGALYSVNFSMDNNITGLNSLDDRGALMDFNRRDYRLEDEVQKNETGEPVLPIDFPAANTTEYRMRVINDPDGAAALLYTTDWATGDGSGIELRRTEILNQTDGVVPTTLRVEIETRHIEPIVSAVTPIEATQVLRWDMAVVSILDDGGFQNLGVLTTNEVSPIYTAAADGNIRLSIGTAITTGEVQYRINGGGWTTGIATSGVVSANIALLTGDEVEIRHTGSTSPDELHFLFLEDLTGSVDAYAILRL